MAFLVMAKIVVFLNFENIAINTNILIKITAWIGFFTLYCFHLFNENAEAYFNPSFGPEDLNLRSYQLSGNSLGPDSFNFFITNISGNGFYATSDSLIKFQNVDFKSKVVIEGEVYTVSGKIVGRKKDGFGVRVTIDKNWDKLYSKVKKLKILE